MAISFEDYSKEVRERCEADGPESVARLEAYQAHVAVAHEVRARRKQCGLTQHQLAEASGIDQGEISRIERARTNPTMSTLETLLAPLGARLGVVELDHADADGLTHYIPHP